MLFNLQEETSMDTNKPENLENEKPQGLEVDNFEVEEVEPVIAPAMDNEGNDNGPCFGGY